MSSSWQDGALGGFFGPLGSYGQDLSFEVAAFSLLVSFALAQLVAATYAFTFRGLSYSRTFVQAVALGSIVATMLMLAINNSIAAGLGIAGSLAIIRFRTAMRDPRDMVFVFASLGAGIASGLRAWPAAVLGTVVFCVGAVVIDRIELGAVRRWDGLLRVRVPSTDDGGASALDGALAAVLRRHTRRFVLVTLREVAQGGELEHAYHVELKDPRGQVGLVRALEALEGLADVDLLLQEPTVEL